MNEDQTFLYHDFYTRRIPNGLFGNRHQCIRLFSRVDDDVNPLEWSSSPTLIIPFLTLPSFACPSRIIVSFLSSSLIIFDKSMESATITTYQLLPYILSPISYYFTVYYTTDNSKLSLISQFIIMLFCDAAFVYNFPNHF